jgi:hypothetical protein
MLSKRGRSVSEWHFGNNEGGAVVWSVWPRHVELRRVSWFEEPKLHERQIIIYKRASKLSKKRRAFTSRSQTAPSNGTATKEQVRTYKRLEYTPTRAIYPSSSCSRIVRYSSYESVLGYGNGSDGLSSDPPLVSEFSP